MGSLSPSKVQMASKYLDKVLLPYNYLVNNPGKNLRRKFATAINKFHKISEEELEELCKLFDMLHSASLIVDDIEDGSDLRRGKPSAHKVYGIPLSLNAANFMYFECLKGLLDTDFGDNDKHEIFYKTIALLGTMHEAQGMEIYWRDAHNFNYSGIEVNAYNGEALDYPTEEEYNDIIVKKTSGQFMLMESWIRGKKGSKGTVNLQKLCELIGTHFQIRDDYLNLISAKYEVGKGFCEDITEGKFSYPIINALNQIGNVEEKMNSCRLLEILRMRTNDMELKLEALTIIRKSRALEIVEKKLIQLQKDIFKEAILSGGRSAIPILSELTNIKDM